MATPDSLDKETGRFGLGEQRSAVVNDTILHIPYCTGDVHAGEKFRYTDVTDFAFCRLAMPFPPSPCYRLPAMIASFAPMFLTRFFSHNPLTSIDFDRFL